MTHPRVLIEEWLPAAAIGVECIRERSTGQQPPDKRLHVWWARRPLTVSRAAVLGSLLPPDFPRDVFERLLGFWGTSKQLIDAQSILDWAKTNQVKVPNPHSQRAFKRALREDHLDLAHEVISAFWGTDPTVIDSMAGGGSIPLEAARLGIRSLANEYNPVACSVLEATVDYPFRFGPALASKARRWGKRLRERFNERLQQFYPSTGVVPPHCYIFARTVPCPDTPGNPPTPLVPDWHLLKPKSGVRVVAEPVVDKDRGTWTVNIKQIGRGAGQLREPPRPTYDNGKGISIFSGRQVPSDYIKAMAQQGKLGSTLYAVALKVMRGLQFQPPAAADLEALKAAECEVARLRPVWERTNVIPTELYPEVSSDERPRTYGMPRWADMFSSRQLLCFGVLVEELRRLRPEIYAAEGAEVGAAVEHLLAFVLDKFANYNSALCSWHAPHAIMRSVFDRHDFSFKATYAEMAPCNSGGGLEWAIDNTLEAFEQLGTLPRFRCATPVEISLGSATSLPQIEDGGITAVVVDPPYADNVQYSELADFFYVWLKRTQGHRRPEWFSTYLCEHDQEAVVNVSRHADGGRKKTADARREAHGFYQRLMTDTFKECRRILREDGVLTVMFTHKKQEAWASLFESLIAAGFAITATWPVKTESEHSLHQAKKNAAQSTVLLVARKRPARAGVGYFDAALRQDIRDTARRSAERLQGEGLNPVDQLVGSFGPAMSVYSRYQQVRTDTGQPVDVRAALEEAAEAVSAWRIEQLAARGLPDVEPEGRFVLLCWDVLGAYEFRFNEAMLLGKAVGMDVDRLVGAGLVAKSGDKILMLSAKERRRDQPLEREQATLLMLGEPTTVRRSAALKVHPNDPLFRTAIDGCHALALRYVEAGRGNAGLGSARSLALQQRWTADSSVARLAAALVNAAPLAVRFEDNKPNSAASRFPEFRAWHALLQPLFGITPPKWEKERPPQLALIPDEAPDEGEDEEDSEEEE